MEPLFDGADPLYPQLGDHGVLASATLADLLMIGIPPSNGQAEPVDIVNHLVNFGWEYVYHCHILSHEEMDMMQPVTVAYPPVAPIGLDIHRYLDARNAEAGPTTRSPRRPSPSRIDGRWHNLDRGRAESMCHW